MAEFLDLAFNQEKLTNELYSLGLGKKIITMGRRSRRWNDEGKMTLTAPYYLFVTEPELTASEVVQVQAVLDAHDPGSKNATTRELFDALTTDSERITFVSDRLF
jgi:hypothetical protein